MEKERPRTTPPLVLSCTSLSWNVQSTERNKNADKIGGQGEQLLQTKDDSEDERKETPSFTKTLVSHTIEAARTPHG